LSDELKKQIIDNRAVTDPKKHSDPDPNPNEVSCRISDPDPIIHKIYIKHNKHVKNNDIWYLFVNYCTVNYILVGI